MVKRTSSRLVLTLMPLIALAQPAAAVDPVFDPMRPNMGPTATAPRQAEREMRRNFELKAPTLTQRFGLPAVSGPLPPAREQPILADPGPAALPPPLPRPQRARFPADRES